MMKKTALLERRIKEGILLSTYVISMLHTYFSGTTQRVDWFLFSDRTKRLDFAVYYTGLEIKFIILAYCLHYHRSISKEVTRFILIITMLDITHWFFTAKQGFGITKIGIAIIIYYVHKLYRKYYG